MLHLPTLPTTPPQSDRGVFDWQLSGGVWSAISDPLLGAAPSSEVLLENGYGEPFVYIGDAKLIRGG
jgi:hypothetical protein